MAGQSVAIEVPEPVPPKIAAGRPPVFPFTSRMALVKFEVLILTRPSVLTLIPSLPPSLDNQFDPSKIFVVAV